MSGENVHAIFDCQGISLCPFFLIREMSFMSLNSEKPTTLHVNLPYVFSHLFKHEHSSVNYSKARHHLQHFFKAIFETHPSAIMGYPRENCHAKHFLDNCDIPSINLDAVGIKESISKLFDTFDNSPEDIKPCTWHSKTWLKLGMHLGKGET